MRSSQATIVPTALRIAFGVALVASLAACGDGGEDQTPTGETTTVADDATSAGGDEETTDDGPSEVPTSDDPTDEVTTENPDATESPGIEDVPTAEVGDCLVIASLLAGGGEGVTDLPTVACTEDHDAQVFAVIDMPDGDFPGDDEVTTAMNDGCAQAFEGFVGTALEESALEADGIFPSADSWAVGDREILCLAFYPDLQTTNETFEGSGL